MQQITSYELSVQQRRLWRRQQADGNAAYRAQALLAVEGNIEAERLKAAVDEVVRRHEILRTGFVQLAGQRMPLATISAEASAAWETVDLRGVRPTEQSAAVEQLWDAELRSEQRPEEHAVLHAKLALLSDQSARLLLHLPALCGDARTLRNLTGEISRAYSGSVEGEVAQEPLQYADLSQWQNELLESADGERGENYWRSRTDASWLAPSVFVNRPHVSPGAFGPRVLSLDIDPRLWERLKSLPANRNSPRVFLLSCWLVLLWRLGGGANEVSVAVAHDGRAYDELKDALGLLEKYLPVGCRPQPGERLSDIAERVAQSLGELETWQEYFRGEDFDESAEAVAQFLPFGFDYESQAPGGWETRWATFTMGRQWVCTDRFRVKLRCVQTDQTLATEWHYDAALHDAEEIRQLAERYQKLLASVADQPQATVDELTVIGDDERRRLLVEWNATEAEYPRERCIHQLFEAQVARTPERVAVIFETQEFTFDELNQRANRLAEHLKELCVGPETLVGICVRRSLDMIVGLLSILKAGGAYVPLDPAFPRERLAFMIEDAEVPVLLTQSSLLPELPPSTARVVCLDDFFRDAAEEQFLNPSAAVSADNLAYVIYTSGSTGKPKGVAVGHRALTNFLCSVRQQPGLAADDVLLSVTTLSFDIAALEIYLPLITGARLVIASREVAADALRLNNLLTTSDTTIMQATPATWRMLIEAGWNGSSKQLKVLCGGEALPRELANQLLDRGVVLWNMYGPTETTIWSALGRINAGAEPICIGRPMANTQAYVLDAQMQPAPIGVAGELYLGGDGVARGYLKRADATAEKFVPHPFARSPGGRLYRTGDVVRYQAGGQIEYLGRSDYQVKVRGYRIELGEIEACLREYERVTEAVVTLHDDASGSGQMIGYVVSAGGQALAESGLRRHLSERLPDYMIPARLVVLKEMPLTPNGKVDRQALPASEQVRAQVREGGREHYSLLEEMLADIWSHVLGVEHVGLQDNFFELGGHSLLAVRLISQLREVFEVEVTLNDIFEATRLQELAKRVEDLVTARPAGKPWPLQRVKRDDEIPLSFAQQRLWFLEQLNPGGFEYNFPAAFRLHGKLDVPALEQSLNEMVRRHESLRTTFAAAGGRPRQVIAPAAILELPIINLSDLNEADRQREVMRLLTEQARAPFDLTRGPLLRTTLLRLDADEHIMLSTMHHIISDGWSMGVLINEVAALYEAFVAGRVSPLAELTIQYADYAVWQRNWLSGEVLEGQLAYWREQLSDAPPVLTLPTDYRRPAVQSFHGTTHSVVVPPELGRELKRLSQGEGMTLFMTLLAAFAALLSRYSGQSDLVIGVPVAGRTRAETEGLIGFFVNTLPFRINIEGDPSFRTLLGRVRRGTLSAYAHQDIPFEKLVEELQPVRDRSRSPLFQVAFVWNNIPHEALAVRELEMTPMDVDGQTAKFDLTLSLTENDDGAVTGDIEYVTELFDAATIHRMTAHFQNLLAAVSASPEKRLSEMSLLTDAERQQQLIEWNDTGRVYAEQGFLPELFAAQVERTPDAVAVVTEDEQLTYAELNRRANRLAHRLREMGVGPDILVGIMAERSVEMVVGLLGILKAGGAYVPLDPAFPTERLAFMIEDAKFPVLLTQSSLLRGLPPNTARIVYLDDVSSDMADEQFEDPIAVVSADSLAYVIYTSGSTGRPKGAMNTHGAIRNRLLWMQDAYELSDEDRVLQKTPFSFDVSVWEFFWPLLNGASLVMARPGGHRDSAYLSSLIAERQITTLHFVPSMLQAFLDEARLEGVDCLKRVICSGETLSNELQERFFARLGAAELDNLYGPTEAAVDVSFWACERDNGRGSVPIGRPIAGTQLYILDGKMRLVPVGVVGELYIGGAGLARGYLGRPDLTGEKFVPHPFSKEAGARLYRTGDLAWYRADGAIEFAGRMDHQIKIRGFRMELGEIETVLGEYAGVSEAVVVASENDASEKRLVAYVVAEDSLSLSAAELRRHAQRHLPEYMVPSAFVLLNELPLTATGKIDRRALPDPGQERPVLETAFAGPRTPFEERLCDIWTDLLQIDRIGVHDNFFELGGHSLLATQLVSRIREAFQVELPLEVLFEFPTINELTMAIATARAAQEDASEVAQMLEHLKQLSPDDVKLMLNTDKPSGQAVSLVAPERQRNILLRLLAGEVAKVTSDLSEALDEDRRVKVEAT